MWTEQLVDQSVKTWRRAESRTGGAERCTLYSSNSLVTWEPGPSTEGRRRRRWKERQQWREKRKLIRCRNVRARARGPEYDRTGTMVPRRETRYLAVAVFWRGGQLLKTGECWLWGVFPSRTISKLHRAQHGVMRISILHCLLELLGEC